MKVKRIVPNLGPLNAEMRRFYGAVLGLDIVMDQGWIATFQGPAEQRTQLSVADQGGSDTELPVLSVEVENLDAALGATRAAEIAVEYGPVTEPWGVRRFYIRDPNGNLLNILAH